MVYNTHNCNDASLILYGAACATPDEPAATTSLAVSNSSSGGASLPSVSVRRVADFACLAELRICTLRVPRRKVAAVFNVNKGDPLPEFYKDWPVIDGDSHDLRINDPSGCIVGLRAKGKINRGSAFVVNNY